MAGIRTLSGLFLVVTLYLPRIFVRVVISLEGCHCNLADRLLFIVQFTLNLGIDFATISVMQPLHRCLVVRYTGRAHVIGRDELVQLVQCDLNHVLLYIGVTRVVITKIVPLFKRVSSRKHCRNPHLSLMARNMCVEGISATQVREKILNGTLTTEDVPECVYEKREMLKAFVKVFE